MSKTPPRPLQRSLVGSASGLCLLITAIAGMVVGPGSNPAAGATALPIVDAVTEVSGSANAFAPARRLSLDSSKPIFPIQVTPTCYIHDNFGDPRSGGRIHQGIDIAATLGQEVYAVVDGTLGHQVIDGEPGSSLSGNVWRLTAAGLGAGASRATWYAYMHLSGFAPGLIDGSVVTQGQLIGYVGDTGNPGPGNYHLHFEVHPDGGAAVDPLTVLSIPAGCTVQ